LRNLDSNIQEWKETEGDDYNVSRKNISSLMIVKKPSREELI
jgi:hypothetical protein